ncbi:D-glucosaminate-6-phosphate ammonia-lyase [Catalinimonas alkaloidigena]|uniref:aminotransferase class V-fold PLP-dependent enzyme n=1 Tax=Catalinimonas alkaloidigena TaxID=1075417 RepID=UPI0024055A90|nr:aminotransferase class V-fold PLP-dependent enzyme [Catalinimonas alkaloidigena]MDF9797251.1 D-glucosaminate-6-phosphate ammonia-lyase [Catalinimonas alkaloidigena]
MNRREIIKQLSLLPLAGTVLPHEAMLNNSSSKSILSTLATEKGKENIYKAIGVDTIVNCRGTFTIIGGSIERPEVLEAMEAASGYFVQYDELAYGIGKRLAEITKAEWGMVSSGCAAGLKHVTAACVTGGNPEKLVRIPDLAGFEKTEVIIPRYSRNVYDHAVRNVGVKVIEVETPEELEKAINERTAMIYIMTGRNSESGQPLSLEVIAGIAKPKNIPILADAAAEDLTIPCVHLDKGATIVAYSGGKAICGPQCAGLLLGDKDLLMSAWQASSPHHGPGRDNKVGKEEMMGMLAAVEAWTTRDHKAEWNTWLSWLDEIAKKVTKIEGVSSNVTEPSGLSNHAPVLHISWDPDKLNITGAELAEELARNKPRVAIGSRDRDGMTSVNVTPNQMKDEDVEVVANRIYGVLSQKRGPRKTDLAAAKADVSGHWEVEVNYFTSISNHALFLEQDGNWIQGTHKADFSMQDIVGMVENDVVKLSSRQRTSGDAISFLFSGKVEGDMFKGSIYLGEYLTAEFSAKRAKYDQERRPVVIPGGPPLAT